MSAPRTNSMATCEHEGPPRERQVEAKPLWHPQGSYAPCIHCGAPLQLARDDAVWTGWVRRPEGWAVYLGAHDESPEYYTRDGRPPEGV